MARRRPTPKQGGDAPLSEKEQARLRSLEQKVKKGLQAYAEAGAALLAIRDEKLYRPKKFEDYCKDVWDLTDSRARQLMRAARVHVILVRAGTPVPVNEGQARELAPLLKNEKTLVAVAKRVLRPDSQATAAEIRAEVRKARGATVAADGRPGVDEIRHQASVATNQIRAAVGDVANSVREMHDLYPAEFDTFIREQTKRLQATHFPNIDDPEWWRPLVGDNDRQPTLDAALAARARAAHRATDRPKKAKTRA